MIGLERHIYLVQVSGMGLGLETAYRRMVFLGTSQGNARKSSELYHLVGHEPW